MGNAKEIKYALLQMGSMAIDLQREGVPRLEALERVAGFWYPRIQGAEYMRNAFRYMPSMALAWAESAFPLVEPSHKLAASLMSTRTPSEYIDEFARMPWRCFGILIPAGLLYDEEALEIVLECKRGGLRTFFIGKDVFAIGEETKLSGYCELEVEDKTDWDSLECPSEILDQMASEAPRQFLLRGRLIVNTCLEMAGTPSGSNPSQKSEIKRKRGEPRCWAFRLTRAVRVDARSHVRDFLQHGGTSPSVQSLVRGHWKRQPCGVASTERRLIHVEPYWRGPEEAPIAVRSHQWR